MYKHASRFLKDHPSLNHQARIWGDPRPRVRAVRVVTDALCRVWWLRLYGGIWQTDRGVRMNDREAAATLRVPIDMLRTWKAFYLARGRHSRLESELQEARRRGLSHAMNAH